MDEIWLCVLLPWVSVVACFFLLKKLYRNKASVDARLFFSFLTLMNILQAVGYLFWLYSDVARVYYADAYLIVVYFFFSQLILFSMSSSVNTVSNVYRLLVYIFPVTFTIFHVNGLMVESYRIEGYAILHNDGLLAWCFDLFAVMACLVSLFFIRKSKKLSLESISSSKKIFIVISFIPIIFIFLMLIGMSRTEHAIPVVIVVPLVSIYTALMYSYLQRDKVIDLSFGLPFLLRRIKLANRLLEMENSKTELKDYKRELERLFILEALDKHNGNIQEVADYLGMNHTTVRNKIKEYEIPLSGVNGLSKKL